MHHQPALQAAPVMLRNTGQAKRKLMLFSRRFRFPQCPIGLYPTLVGNTELFLDEFENNHADRNHNQVVRIFINYLKHKASAVPATLDYDVLYGKDVY
jgi:hypothetical protein